MPAVTSSKWLTPDRDAWWWHKPDRVKVCTKCGEEKTVDEFSAYGYTTNQGKRSTRYESRCKPCARKRQADYRLANPDVTKAQNKRRDPAMLARVARAYQQTEHGRAKKAYHQRLRKARMRSRAGDNTAIRAIYAEAMAVEHIVALCPVFDLPELGKKMHVDHIMPLAKGGKHEASNLQILPIGLNMRKGTKCPL
jgi:5-methylcytosine-specific restriction endonuclease McrA